MCNTYVYYYNFLSPHLQRVYSNVLEALRSHTKNVAVPFITTPEMESVINYIVLDHPLISFFDEYKYIFFQECVCGIEFKYLLGDDTQAFINKEIIAQANKITDYARLKGDDPVLQIKAIHEFFTKRVKYCTESNYAFNAIGPLLFGKGVCIGISASFKLLLDLLDTNINCISVSGKYEGEAHAWNLVYYNGQWHPFDLTASVCLSKDGCYSFEGFCKLYYPEKYTTDGDIPLPKYYDGDS